MQDSQLIDKIYAELLQSSSDPDYGFYTLQGQWGYRNSEIFQNKRLAFMRSLRRLAKDCHVLYNDGQYYVFNGKIYIAVREELVATSYKLLIEYLQIGPAIGDKSMCREFLDTIRYYNRLVPRNDVVAFSNGVLDMRDYEFHNFSPDFHVTYYRPFPYDPEAKCTKWRSFLHEVLPSRDARITLQMFLGLGLIERGIAYNPYEGKESAKVELCLILIGSGSNGKSVIFNTAMGIYGKERISGIDYDELTSQGDEGMRARRLLRNAIFNWSSDSDSRTFGRRRTGVFKRIVSGEPVTDRKIGEDVQENDRLPYLIFNLNELPYPEDQSLGFIRRLQFVSFDVTIPKDKQNPNLSMELKSEYSGIFNWIVRGSKELRKRRFVFPSSEGNRRQMLLAQLQVDPVVAWVNAYNVRWEPQARGELGVWISADTMMKSIATFCEDNGGEMVSMQKFGSTMKKIGGGFTKRRTPNGMLYQVYGCNEERLKIPFDIGKEDLSVAYTELPCSYIESGD